MSLVALGFSSNGTLYGAGNELVTINTMTGAATIIGNIHVGGTNYGATGDLTFSSSGTLYMTAYDPSLCTSGSCPSDLLKVDPTSGASTLIGATGFNNVFGLEFDGGTLYGLNDSGQLISINPINGSGTLVADTSPEVIGMDLAVEAAPVPEPASLLLLGSSIVGFSVGRRRFSKAKRAG